MIRNSKTRLCSTLLATAAAIILTACTREPDAIPAPLPQDSLPAPAASAPGPAKAAADEPAPAARKPTAEMLSMMEMMRAIYADNAEYRDADLITDLPEPKKRSVVGSFLLQPVAMHELPDGQVAMIAAAQQVDSNGKPFAYLPRLTPKDVYYLYNPDGYYRMR